VTHSSILISAHIEALRSLVLAQLTTGFGGHAPPSENGFKVVMAVGAGAAAVSRAEV
jgi:hypothetical protein